MGADQASGHQIVTGCRLRGLTGDLTGGLTLNQIDAALRTLAVPTEVYVGAAACTPAFAARRLSARRAVGIQGNTGALLGTPYKDTGGSANHYVLLSAARGGTSDAPAEVLVFDPAADGRRTGIADGPDWWPWQTVLRFAAALRPWGNADPRTLGYGRWYCHIFPAGPPEPAAKYHVRIEARALVRIYTLTSRPGVDCIAGWTADRWGSKPSSAPCEAPIHRETCDGKSGAVTVKVTGGRYAGKHIRVGNGTTVSEV
jgi:hypothetical protein